MARHRLTALPLLLALLLAASAFALSACGYSSDSKDVSEGEPVELGALKYNVIFSRYLNRHDNEDSAYLVGQPEPPEGHGYFGVFLEVQNKSEETQTLSDSFTITDAGHQTFKAIPSESLYAFPFGGRSPRRNRSRSSTRPPSRARSRARWCSSSCPPRPPRTVP